MGIGKKMKEKMVERLLKSGPMGDIMNQFKDLKDNMTEEEQKEFQKNFKEFISNGGITDVIKEVMSKDVKNLNKEDIEQMAQNIIKKKEE